METEIYLKYEIMKTENIYENGLTIEKIEHPQN